jgi:membrane protein
VKVLFGKLKYSALNFFKKFLISLQLYFENGLPNHAAACAYGFLLSMAPTLLLIVFFIFYTFRSSPGSIAALIGTIPILDSIFDEKWLSTELFFFSNPGIISFISLLSIFWACRVLALAIQRGLRNVFPAEDKRNPVKKTLLILTVEVSVLIFVFIVIISSRTALRIYEFLNFLPNISIIRFIATNFGIKFISIILFGAASFFVYISVPINSPRKSSAFQGALFCTVAYLLAVLIFGAILNKARYNFLYGTFGNLVLILINVYLFFTFFFIGAQLAFVLDSFDMLLFSRLRKFKNMDLKKGKMNSYFLAKFLSFSKSDLNTCLRDFKEGEIIFSYIGAMGDIFYILEGEVEVLISSSDSNEKFAGILKAGSIFGEVDYILSENQSAVVKEKTDVSLFMMPPELLDAVLKYDKILT